jgi:hypothetical protein
VLAGQTDAQKSPTPHLSRGQNRMSASGTSATCTASANSSAIPPKRTYEVLLLSVYETGGRALIEGCAAKEWRNRHRGRIFLLARYGRLRPGRH